MRMSLDCCGFRVMSSDLVYRMIFEPADEF
jgi:hypothetical protein